MKKEILLITETDNFDQNSSRGSYPYELGNSLRPNLYWLTEKK